MKTQSSFPVATLKAHLALNVRNVETGIDFYRRMFGIEPSKVRTGYAKFDVLNPPLNLTLNEVTFNERGALSHLGIQVGSTEDVMAIRRMWNEAGLATQDEMRTNCCYAIQDKTWVNDPDGNEWEAFVVLEDNLAETGMCCLPDADTADTDTDRMEAARMIASTQPATEPTATAPACCAPGCC